MPPSPLAGSAFAFRPLCEVTAFTVFIFNGAIDLAAVPFCATSATRAIRTERPRPFSLCEHCLTTYVHTLARIGTIPPVCPLCATGECAPRTNPFAPPEEWNRDPERHSYDPRTGQSYPEGQEPDNDQPAEDDYS